MTDAIPSSKTPINFHHIKLCFNPEERTFYSHCCEDLKITNTHFIGPKRDGVTEGWRKLHNEELQNLYSSQSIIRIIKSRRMRWAGHVA
jgi:hypothetical protein